MEIQPTIRFFNAALKLTAKIKMKERTSNLVYTAFTKHQVLKNCFFRIVVPLWNAIPRKLIMLKVMKKLKQQFHRKFIHEADGPQLVKILETDNYRSLKNYSSSYFVPCAVLIIKTEFVTIYRYRTSFT